MLTRYLGRRQNNCGYGFTNGKLILLSDSPSYRPKNQLLLLYCKRKNLGYILAVRLNVLRRWYFVSFLVNQKKKWNTNNLINYKLCTALENFVLFSHFDHGLSKVIHSLILKQRFFLYISTRKCSYTNFL